MLRKPYFITFLSVALVIIALLVFNFLKNDQVRRSNPYKSLLGVNGVETKVVNISGCMPTPDVAGIKRGATVRFSNTDGQTHALFFGQANFEVPPHGFLDVAFNFYRAAGPRKYDCDSKKDVGIISVFSFVSSSTPNLIDY